MGSLTASTRTEPTEREAARDRLATDAPAVGIVPGSAADRPGMAGTADGQTGLDAFAFREGAK